MKTIVSLINDYLNSQTKKQIITREIENYLAKVLGQDVYWQQGGYSSFVEKIEALMQSGIISPVKTSGLNGRQPPLYEKYRIRKSEDILDSMTRQKLLTGYHPQINTAYYSIHSKDYQADEPYLAKLDSFLKQHSDFASWPMITANERSFQIFHNEKWLLSKQGHLFCQRTGLSLTTLHCYQTSEPFFYYPVSIPRGTKEIKVLIVENKDTFFSLKGLFQQGLNTWADNRFSLLIYGEGRKIQKSFSFYEELGEYQNYQAAFYYFGDLDPEGIRIWYDLQKEYRLIIKPFTLFYQVLFERYGDKAPTLSAGKKAGQRYSEKAIKAFLNHFDPCLGAGIRQMLAEKRYLPQEGLDYVLLKELAVK
ncbi:MAG: DUF2220 family protein [Desulfitobacteriaceae bacterium]|nr:DUF2220 family protein [Desulfitobacteriaceae bacterium]